MAGNDKSKPEDYSSFFVFFVSFCNPYRRIRLQEGRLTERSSTEANEGSEVRVDTTEFLLGRAGVQASNHLRGESPMHPRPVLEK
jgi:hypothetical protein